MIKPGVLQSMGLQSWTRLSDWRGEGNGTPLQYSCLENPMDGRTWWAAVHGVARSRTRLSDFTLFFHFHALEKEIATHSSVLAWRIPGTGEPGGLPSVGSHRVGHDWSNLAAAAAERLKDWTELNWYFLIQCLRGFCLLQSILFPFIFLYSGSEISINCSHKFLATRYYLSGCFSHYFSTHNTRFEYHLDLSLFLKYIFKWSNN